MKKTKVGTLKFKRASIFQIVLSITLVGCLVAYIIIQTKK